MGRAGSCVCGRMDVWMDVYVCVQPSRKLSPERPVSSVFAPSVLLSIVGQAAIHFTTLIWGWKTASELRPMYLATHSAVHTQGRPWRG